MYFDEKEKRYIALIESNLKHFNTGRRKKLLISYYVSNGNKALILWGGATVAADLTIQEAHCFIWGFTRGREGK